MKPRVNRSKSAAPTDTTDGESRRSTSERLLDTAAKLFWTKGYASTTTREIAALLGVRKASLYHHVSSKEDILYDISVASLDHIRSSVQTAVDAVSDPLQQLRTLIRAHVVAMLVDPSKHSTMLTELRALSDDRRAEIVALRDAYEELVHAVLDRAQRCGVIRDDIPVKYLSLSLLNLLNGTIFWFQRDGDLSPEELAEVFTTLFVSGVGRSCETPTSQ